MRQGWTFSSARRILSADGFDSSVLRRPSSRTRTRSLRSAALGCQPKRTRRLPRCVRPSLSLSLARCDAAREPHRGRGIARAQCYAAHRDDILHCTENFGRSSWPSYRNLDWRVEVEVRERPHAHAKLGERDVYAAPSLAPGRTLQIGRRSVQHIAEPMMMLRLDLHDQGARASCAMSRHPARARRPADVLLGWPHSNRSARLALAGRLREFAALTRRAGARRRRNEAAAIPALRSLYSVV